MKEIPMIQTTVRKSPDSFYVEPLFLERDWCGIKKVYETSEKGNRYEIGEYNHESFLVECEEGKLLNYLVEYKGYTVFATTPVTSGYGTTWKGSGQTITSTKIIYSLKKPEPIISPTKNDI